MKLLKRLWSFRFSGSIIALRLLAFLWLFSTISISQDENTSYPETVHKLFLERMRKLKGADPKQGGSWGHWSSWSSCSRSCGTGVSTQTRECEPIHRRKRRKETVSEGTTDSCIGRYKRYQTCNAQICPGGPRDFRGEQCASFNKTPFDKKFYTWEPYMKAPNPCTLNCRAVGLSFYATLNQSVIDGTSCWPFDRRHRGIHNRICVEGRCVDVGCDGVLGSGRVIDACGQCGGDNSTCRVISGVYSRTRLPFGYNLIATLPTSAVNVSIYHVKPSSNYLALKELGGRYFLNGPSKMNSSGSFTAAGTIFTYIRPQSFQGDRLHASGPLTHSVDVMLFYQGANPGIRYEYRLPALISRGQPKRQSISSQRSSSTLSGTYHRQLSQTQNRINQPPHGHNSLSLLSDDPYFNNSKAFATPYSAAINSAAHSPHIYSNSVLNYNYPKLSNELTGRLSSKQKNEWSPKNHHIYKSSNQLQQLDKLNPAFWSPNPRSKDGFPLSSSSHRLASAGMMSSVQKVNENNFILPLLSAKANNVPSKPGLVNDAALNEADTRRGISWKKKHLEKKLSSNSKRKSGRKKRKFILVSKGFSDCSQTCGGGYQRTRFICVKKRKKGQEVPFHFCSNEKPPPAKQVRCNLRPCPPVWQPDEWSPCSVTCGLGVQMRDLICTKGEAGHKYLKVPEEECEDAEILPRAKVCQMVDCDGPPKWRTERWSECSKRCGLGFRTREVKCVKGRDLLQEDLCTDEKPATEEICDMGSCASDTWFFSPWDPICWGPCGEGVQRRRVHCSGDALDNQENASSCPKSAKPSDTKLCEATAECGGSWFTGPWSECDAHCGPGQKRRAVVCVTWSKSRYKVTSDDSLCKASGERPKDTMPCHADCEAEWFTSQWSDCSVPCGDGGVQRREVKCLDEDFISSLECHRGYKPDSRQACNSQSCDKELDNRVSNYPNDSANSKVLSNLVTTDSSNSAELCLDRMKNCHLVYKARLCKLKYYNVLCCKTCKSHQ